MSVSRDKITTANFDIKLIPLTVLDYGSKKLSLGEPVLIKFTTEIEQSEREIRFLISCG